MTSDKKMFTTNTKIISFQMVKYFNVHNLCSLSMAGGERVVEHVTPKLLLLLHQIIEFISSLGNP